MGANPELKERRVRGRRGVSDPARMEHRAPQAHPEKRELFGRRESESLNARIRKVEADLRALCSTSAATNT
jgi:hypothetical protein